MFISRSLLGPLVESKHIFIDVTFQTVPKIFHQLVTIHFSAYGNVSRQKHKLVTSHLALRSSLTIFLVKLSQTFPIAICAHDQQGRRNNDYTKRSLIMFLTKLRLLQKRNQNLRQSYLTSSWLF